MLTVFVSFFTVQIRNPAFIYFISYFSCIFQNKKNVLYSYYGKGPARFGCPLLPHSARSLVLLLSHPGSTYKIELKSVSPLTQILGEIVKLSEAPKITFFGQKNGCELIYLFLLKLSGQGETILTPCIKLISVYKLCIGFPQFEWKDEKNYEKNIMVFVCTF